MTVREKINAGAYTPKYRNAVAPQRPPAPPLSATSKECMAHAVHLEAFEKRLAEYHAAMGENATANGKACDEFRADVLAELGLTDHPKADKLWAMAWDRGHSGGYEDVLSVAQDYAELLAD